MTTSEEGSPADATNPAPPPQQPPAPPRSKWKWWIVAIGVAIVVVLLVGALGAGGAVWFVTSRSAEAEVFLEPQAATGTDPFTPNAGTDTPATSSLPTTTRAPSAPQPGGVVGSSNGDTPGLYGGTGNNSSCNIPQLADFLESQPTKARAFVSALNSDPTFRWTGGTQIATSQLRAYLTTELTPTVLLYDTRVVNHGFKRGRATSFQAILQAGTAVLVDRFGYPRVKCGCGNPLGRPRPLPGPPRYHGHAWPGFNPGNVIIVNQTTIVINAFTLIDIRNGTLFQRPAGTNGGQDGGPGLPASIAGTYTLSRHTVTCVGFENGCAETQMSILIECPGGQCTVTWLGIWGQPHAITFDGATWRASGQDIDGECNGVNRVGPIVFELTVTSGAVIDNTWRAKTLQGTYHATASAVSGCKAGEAGYTLTGQRSG